MFKIYAPSEHREKQLELLARARLERRREELEEGRSIRLIYGD